MVDAITALATRPGFIRALTASPIVVFLAIAIGACGDGGGPGTDRAGTPTPAPATAAPSPAGGESDAAPYTREQVVEALGVTRGRDENGVMNSDLKTGCFASKVFVTPADNMAAYQQIGDPVATNPSGEVGAAVGTYAGVSAAKCLRIFTRRLSKLT
jgi:hypothetical protein